jgi:hypothetical protein
VGSGTADAPRVTHGGDPDGYFIELGQSTGLLKGKLAKKRPEDLPG